MDYDTIRQNDRIRGLATLADNGALALWVAGVARAYDKGEVDSLAIAAIAFGLIFIYIAWHVRGLLQAEG